MSESARFSGVRGELVCLRKAMGEALMGTTEFEEKCELNIVLRRRYGTRLKRIL